MVVGGLAAAMPASAAVQWTFDTTAPPSPPPCASAGSSWGNTVNCNATSSPSTSPTLSAKAWSDTNTSAGSNLLETGYVNVFGGGLGVTNRGDSARSTDPGEGGIGSSTPPEHSMDSQGRYDSILLTFSRPVTMTGAVIGWSSTDSDISLLAYTGPTVASIDSTLNNKMYSQLTTQGWSLVGHYSDLAVGTTQLVNGATTVDNTASTSVQSQYWLIGTFNPLVSPAPTWTSGNDYVKLLSIYGVERRQTPEPNTLALLGLAAGSAVWLRRRSLKK